MTFGIHDRYNSRSEVSLRSWQRSSLMEELGPIAFEYPKHCAPLQSADMLSNEIYRCWLKLVDGRTEDSSRVICSGISLEMPSTKAASQTNVHSGAL